MLKKGLVILIAVLIILAIIGLLLPRNIHAELAGARHQGELIAATARKLFPG